MLIAKITESDFFGGEPQFIEDSVRYNVRGILHDGKGKIALMKLENSKYYKLPGGRIEITETPKQAFIREISEALGYTAEISGYLGWIEEHKAKRKFCMVSHCFVATLTSTDCKKEILACAEERLGFTLEWIKFEDAILKFSELADVCDEYLHKFVLKREYLILEKAKEIIA